MGLKKVEEKKLLLCFFFGVSSEINVGKIIHHLQENTVEFVYLSTFFGEMLR